MDISPACTPPTQPRILDKDREHPLFPLYMQYRSSMSALLVEAASFETWKNSREAEKRDQEIIRHPRFREFQEWMVEHQGGARKCPAGMFPNNFMFWLEGGRW